MRKMLQQAPEPVLAVEVDGAAKNAAEAQAVEPYPIYAWFKKQYDDICDEMYGTADECKRLDDARELAEKYTRMPERERDEVRSKLQTALRQALEEEHKAGILTPMKEVAAREDMFSMKDFKRYTKRKRELAESELRIICGAEAACKVTEKFAADARADSERKVHVALRAY